MAFSLSRRSVPGLVLLLAATVPIGLYAFGAQNQGRGAPPPAPTLGLSEGTLDFDTPDFTLKLVKASQTIAALEPKGGNGFDFTPADRLDARASDRFNLSLI